MMIFDLTTREMAIVQALLTRKTYRDVGLEIGMSEQTVKNHIHAIYSRVGAANQAQMIWLLRHKLEEACKP